MQLKRLHYRILWLLDRDSSISYSEIGRQLDLSKQSVRYYVEQLVEAGIIEGYVGIIDFQKLGLIQYRSYCTFEKYSEEIEKKITEKLKANDRVFWLCSYLGNWDIQIVYLVKNLLELNDVLKEIQDPILSKFSRQSYSLAINTFHLNRDYLVQDSPRKLKFNLYQKVREPFQLDAISVGILRELALNCRKTTREISSNLDVSKSQVEYRLRALESEAVLSRKRLLIDLRLINLQRYKVKIRLKACQKKREEEIYSFCIMQPGVVTLSQVIGNWQIDFDVEVKERRHLIDLIRDLRKKFNDIIDDMEVLEALVSSKVNYFPFKNW